MSENQNQQSNAEKVGAAAALVFLVAAAGTMVGSCLRSFVQLGESLAERRDRKKKEGRTPRMVKVPRPATRPAGEKPVLRPVQGKE